MKLATALKVLPLLLAGYLLAWCSAYVYMMLSRGDRPSWREGYEYFVLAWTFRAGELPGFIWLYSLVVFALMVGVATFAYRKVKRRRAGGVTPGSAHSA